MTVHARYKFTDGTLAELRLVVYPPRVSQPDIAALAATAESFKLLPPREDPPAPIETGPPSLPSWTGPEGAQPVPVVPAPLAAAPPKPSKGSALWRGTKTGLWSIVGGGGAESVTYALNSLTSLHLPAGLGLAVGAALAGLGSGLHQVQKNKADTESP